MGAGIDALQRGQDLSYYHRDEQLSTAFITSAEGEVQNSYLYDVFGARLETDDAFGAELEVDEQFQNRIRYTGQQYDDMTGQYYLRARYYNSIAGRFLQEDTYWGDGLNLYAYCGNNPVMYWDPSGYEVTSNPLFNSNEDFLWRIQHTPTINSSYGHWDNGRGNSAFIVEQRDALLSLPSTDCSVPDAMTVHHQSLCFR